MMIFESVASLRPQPYGLPFQGRATQIDGFKAKRNEWQVATQNRTRTGKHHLIFTASWFKIGVRRITLSPIDRDSEKNCLASPVIIDIHPGFHVCPHFMHES
jgi:hypothetical protein